MNKLFLLLGLCLLATHAAATEGSGAHGADIEADQNNVWFLGPQPIEFCLNVDPKSGLDAGELRKLILDSFSDWRQFFITAGYYDKQLGKPGAFPPLLDYQFQDKIPREMSLYPSEVATCTKREHQIEFRFSKNSEADWSLDTNHAFGAAIRGPYDHKTYRTGGVIWISTALKGEPELKHVVLHELGHMFGMPHNSTYVMYEKIGRLIQLGAGTKNVKSVLGIIESAAWKYMIWPGADLEFTNMEVSGGISGTRGQTSPFLGFSPSFIASPTKLTFHHQKTNGVYEFSINLGFGSKQNRMRGFFHRRFHHFDVGPGVHTKWVKDGKVFEGRLHFEMFRAGTRVEAAGGSKQIPLEGFFIDKNDVSYPAIIEFPFGAVVKLYDTKSSAWFSLSSYPYETAP